MEPPVFVGAAQRDAYFRRLPIFIHFQKGRCIVRDRDDAASVSEAFGGIVGKAAARLRVSEPEI